MRLLQCRWIERIELKRLTSGSECEVVVVAVGLIRKL